MPDTTYILGDAKIDVKALGLPDSTTAEITKIINQNEVNSNTNSSYNLWHSLPTLIFSIVIFYFLVKIIVVVLDTAKQKIEQLLGVKFNNEDSNDEGEEYHYKSSKDYLIYTGSNLGLSNKDIIDILEKYYTYYRNLDKHLQHKFYDRLYRFMHTKQFIIHTNEPFKEMPVLISAAAVQISFGLDDFELPHYPYIQIHKEEYFANDSLRVLAGNVQGSCITLAWNQLLKGFSNYEDGSNVGLHEMAHALYFQEIVVDRDNDNFELHFSELMYRGETVLEQKKCPHNLYTDYAFSNLQEFWAVSVELFFERAQDLYNYYPKVFTTLQDILKQNPISASQPV